MHIKTLQPLVVAVIFLFAAQAARADIWVTPHFTNATVVANSQQVLRAIQSGDGKHITDALIGSPVAFVGEARYVGGGTNIMVRSNIVLNVVLKPQHFVGVRGAFSEVEVMGTLQRVDFERRIIYITAKPEDYLSYFTL